jgi:hypothetical protein
MSKRLWMTNNKPVQPLTTMWSGKFSYIFLTIEKCRQCIGRIYIKGYLYPISDILSKNRSKIYSPITVLSGIC